MLDHPEVVELDINPILADAEGVIAIDARVRWMTCAPAAVGDRAISAATGNERGVGRQRHTFADGPS